MELSKISDTANVSPAIAAAAVQGQASPAAVIRGHSPVSAYVGDGSCPVSVERGNTMLADIGSGGARTPSFPSFRFNGAKPTRAAWGVDGKGLPQFVARRCRKAKSAWQSLKRSRSRQADRS